MPTTTACTPYRLDIIDGLGPHSISDADDSLVAILLTNTPREIRETNGEFIVRAVNSHEALLAACAAAERFIEGDQCKLYPSAQKVVDQLREAISVAEGNT